MPVRRRYLDDEPVTRLGGHGLSQRGGACAAGAVPRTAVAGREPRNPLSTPLDPRAGAATLVCWGRRQIRGGGQWARQASRQGSRAANANGRGLLGP